MPDLSHYGEEAVVARLTTLLEAGPGILTGPGDDCAVVEGGARGEAELLKTDCLVCNVHFLPEDAPGKVGWKAIARTLSDFAAMGGWPRHLLVTLAVPPSCEMRWAEQLYRGMNKCARAYDCSIVGGETSSVPAGAPVMISVAGTGTARRSQVILRSGGRPGDLLFVTGRLGGSLRGSHLTFTPRLLEANWLVRNFTLHAMMDLSDGLARDLPRLAAASGCGVLLEKDSLPRSRGVTIEQALCDGEDYELLFAVSARTAKRLVPEWRGQFPDLPLSLIGSLTADQQPGLSGGWDHFGG
ncbi:MAG: thiamine-phosphate kinase [Roseibacillus sp.]|nr:thiamine-phosphate kinase [Roseibacillus sp.]